MVNTHIIITGITITITVLIIITGQDITGTGIVIGTKPSAQARKMSGNCCSALRGAARAPTPARDNRPTSNFLHSALFGRERYSPSRSVDDIPSGELIPDVSHPVTSKASQ